MLGPRTVMLLGTHSPEHLRNSTSAVAASLPHVQVVDLPGQGHAALETAPAMVADTVLRHVATPG